MARPLIVVLLLGIVAAAHADPKTDSCEKGKKFLAEQEAKGKCQAESDEAKKITCSATTAPQVSDLVAKCNLAGVPKCRALDVADPKVVFDEAQDKLSTACLRKLVEKLQQKWCSVENKGKKFDYMTEYDHTIGAGQYAKKVKGAKAAHTCRTVKK